MRAYVRGKFCDFHLYFQLEFSMHLAVKWTEITEMLNQDKQQQQQQPRRPRRRQNKQTNSFSLSRSPFLFKFIKLGCCNTSPSFVYNPNSYIQIANRKINTDSSSNNRNKIEPSTDTQQQTKSLDKHSVDHVKWFLIMNLYHVTPAGTLYFSSGFRFATGNTITSQQSA